MGRSRMTAVLGNIPLNAERTATGAWLFEVGTLLAGTPAGPDRARLLEARAAVRAGLAREEDPGTAGGSRGADGPAEDAIGAAGLYEAAGMVQEAAACYAIAAGASARTGRFSRAVELAVRSLVCYSSIPEADRDPRGAARLTTRFGLVCGYLQDYRRAAEFAEIAAGHSEQTGDRVRWSVATHNTAEMLVWQVWQAAGTSTAPPGVSAGERSEQNQVLLRAERLARELLRRGEPGAFRSLYGPRLLAAILCERGEARQAWSVLEGMDHPMGTVSRTVLASLRRVRGRCLQLLARPVDALAELDAAIALLADDGDFAEHVDALRLRSAVRESLGDLSGALADSQLVIRRLRLRQAGQENAFMDQVFSRAGMEGERRFLLARTEILTRTAEQDPLTGLANRRGVERVLGSLGPGERTCLVLLDVDHFKSVNDRFGHPVGDEVLQRLGRLLVSAVRGVDRVARWGGEEFLLVLPGQTAHLGREAAERIRRVVAAYPWDMVRPGLGLTVSIGVACGLAERHPELLRSADRALYQAKNSGRNRVVAAPELPEQATD
jgi:diguanylate cyclase (GGDEF)-like protein